MLMKRFRELWRDKSGVAAMEFAVLLPVLVALFIGSLEVTFKIWSTQKAEKLAVTLSDVISQSKAVTNSDLEKLIGAVDRIMDPFPFGNNGKVIISSIYVAQGEEDAKVNWQCIYPSSGGYSAVSKFGTEGNIAALPAGFTLAQKDNIIAAEVFYTYEPIAPGVLFDNAQIYRRAMFKPRLGTLVTDPGC